MSKCIFLTTLRRYLAVISAFVLVFVSLGVLPTVHGQEATPIVDPASPDTGSDGPVPEIPDGYDVEVKPEQWMNHDAIYVSNEFYGYSLGPGQQATTQITYSVTTPRDSTTISFALMRDGQTATGWAIAISGTSGTSGDGSASTTYTDQTSLVPDTSFAISISVTAPVSLAADETVTLHATSTAVTAEGSETGVMDAGPLMSYTVLAPTPTPSPTAESVIASPTPTTTLEPSPTPEPTATSVPVIDDRFAMTPGQPAAVSLLAGATSEFDVNYVVTSARTSTTFTAVVIDLATSDLATGWIVSLNGQADFLVVTSGVSAGTTLPLHVTVTAPVEAESGQNLVVQVSSAVQSVKGAVTLPTTASISVPVGVAGDPGFSAQSVSDGDQAHLDCVGQGGANDLAYDNIVPGQIIQFTCTFKVTGLALLPTVRSTISVANAPDNWAIAGYAAGIVALGGVDVVGNQTEFIDVDDVGNLPLEFTTLTVLGGTTTFKLMVRADPHTPLDIQGGAAVARFRVQSQCLGTYLQLAGSSCMTLGGERTVYQSDLNVQVNKRSGSTAGGALLDQLILGPVTKNAGEALFTIECPAPSTIVVQPGQTIGVNCTIKALLGLSALQLLQLGGEITTQGSSEGWNTLLAPGHVDVQSSGALSLPLGTIGQADLIAGYPFTLFFTAPGCATAANEPINSISVVGDFDLKLLGGLSNVELTDSIAVVPVQMNGDPLLAVCIFSKKAMIPTFRQALCH